MSAASIPPGDRRRVYDALGLDAQQRELCEAMILAEGPARREAEEAEARLLEHARGAAARLSREITEKIREARGMSPTEGPARPDPKPGKPGKPK